MPDESSTDYIGSVEYNDVLDKLKTLKCILDDKTNTQLAARRLRYADVAVEQERATGRLQPDELYIPQHIIDTNIRREQSAYVQYITQSPRAVVTQDRLDDSNLALLDKDLTYRLRFDGWQLPMFSNIDAFQSMGYSVMEVVQDLSNPGNVGYESFPFGDFAFTTDTKDVQSVEFTARQYFYTKTRLIELCGDPANPKDSDWNRTQVDAIISKEPDNTTVENAGDRRDRSLYRVFKNMFKVSGTTMVGWSAPDTCSDWVRKPRPLFLGRRKEKPPVPGVMGKLGGMIGAVKQAISGVMDSAESYENTYPYIIFPYLISENDTISELKGRVFLDQDLQEAVSSLLSSTCTQARRAAGLYASRDTTDPNDDFMMQKNVFLKSGCVVNAKLNFFKLDGPDPGMFSAIQALISSNQNETSQVNFAAMNRKDSRKTAKEISVSERQEQILSTVQVVLFSIALTQLYRLMVDIIKSRVQFGLITNMSPQVKEMYAKDFVVKPSGDSDVIEKQQLLEKMRNDWPVVQNTPLAVPFFLNYLKLAYPDDSVQYEQIINQNQQQQQSQQAQQQQQMMQAAIQLASGVVELSKHKDFFSEVGQLHAYPVVQQAATMIENMKDQMMKGQKQNANQ